MEFKMTRIDGLRNLISDLDGAYITGKANISYYSGFTSEDAALLITKNRAVIFTDSRYTIQANAQCKGFEIYDAPQNFRKLLEELELSTIGYEEDYITVSSFERLKSLSPKTEFIPSGNKISKPRMMKSSEEIKKLQHAEELGDAAFSHILNFIHTGISERDVAFELEMFMKKNGASALSFETIVASGARSAMPHGVASDKIIEYGDFVTLDFGCVLDGYCSDMTRTIVMGKADSRQREIYDTVLKAQNTALKAITQGIACKEIDKLARDVISSAGYGKYFSHSLGHSVGLEIHELPNFSPKSDALVEAGNVITVEPGIYIAGFGGVRIEDIVAITPKNVLNLTKSQKELIII